MGGKGKSLYTADSAYRLSILFASILLILLGVSHVFALVTTPVAPAATSMWGDTVTLINATTDYPANCTYNITDYSNDVAAGLDGNNSLNHSATNIDITVLDQGDVDVFFYCWNASNASFSHNSSVSIIHDTGAPDATMEISNHTWYDTATPYVFFNVSDIYDDPIAYAYFIDGSLNNAGVSENGTTNTTAAISSQSQGNHTVLVQATDEVGNKANSSLYTIHIDTVDPAVSLVSPDDYFNTSTSISSLTFNVTDNLGGPYNCSLYLNGVYDHSNASTENDTSTQFTVGLANGTYVWNVTCLDNASRQDSASRTFTIDQIPPTPIIEELNHSWFDSSTVSIDFNVTDNLFDPISYQFYLDGVANASGSVANASTSASANLVGVADGVHALILEATDGAGNAANSSSWTIYVDTADPTVNLVSPVDNDNTSTSISSLTFNITDALGGPYNCSLYLNGVYDHSNASTENDTGTQFDVSLTNGTFVWNVTCVDNASRQDSASRTFTIDQIPPTPIIEELNHSWFDSSTLLIDFNVTDNLFDPILYQSYLDGGANTGGSVVNASPSASASLVGVADGMHALVMEATDGAGNAANSSSWTVYVDTADPVVTPMTGDNSNFSSAPAALQFNVSDNMGGPYACYLYIDGVYNNTANASTANATTTSLSFGAVEGSYTWYVNCTDNASNWDASTGRTVTLDFVGPVINMFDIDEADDFVSDNTANNNITLLVNVTDTTTGVRYVTANLTDLSGSISQNDYENLTYDSGSGLWNLTVTVNDSSTWDFEAANITLTAYDYAAHSQAGGQDFYTLILYNMTTPPLQSPCFQFSGGTTDFSAETDFVSVDFTVVVDWFYSAGCLYYGLGADNAFHTVAKVNFSGLNMSDDATVQKLSGLQSALIVELTPDNNWGDSRVYINTSFFSELNTTATVELYNLPFDDAPNITADVDAAGYNAGSVVYTTYTHPTYGVVGNLSFNVAGFSGYNISDSTGPSITVNAPTPNMTTFQGSTRLINVTVNGTGTQVSNVTVVLDGTTYYLYNMTCSNATGDEMMNCYFTPGFPDGTHQFVVNAWDYGGSEPGNYGNKTWNFTSDTTAPAVVGGQNNASGQVSLITPVKVNVTVTDTTNVTSVIVRNVSMNDMGGGYYEVNTTAGALGCSAGSTCALTLNATDHWGYSNTTENASSLSIAVIPTVGGTSLNTSLSTRNVTSTTVFQINVTVASGVAHNVTLYNGSLIQLTNMTGTIWQANTTATAVSCLEGVCSLVVNVSDNLGNQDQGAVQIGVDDTAPAVTALVRAPTEVKNTSTLQFNATVTDSSTISSVVANNSVAMSLNGSVYSVSTTAAALGCAEGNCTLGVTATDVPGNSNSTESTWVVVDDTAPVVNFIFNSTDTIRSAGTVILNITVTESNTVSSVEANGVAMSQIGATTTWYVSDTGTNLGCLSSGSCNVTFVANDTAGNSGSDSTLLTIDNEGPVVSGPNVTNTTSGRAKIGTVVNIRVTASDSPAGVSTVTVNGSTMYLVSGYWQANVSGTTLGCPANAVCTIGFNATDNSGNSNTTVTTNYTIDDAAPTNTSNFSASATTNSATVSATMDELSKCTVTYGTNTSAIGGEANASSFSTSLSVALSGLSASTTYYYNITDCWDELGNNQDLGIGPLNFTTGAAPSGGGGGGGGSYTVTSTVELGDLTGAQVEVELGRGDDIFFSHDAEEHSLRVLRLTEDYADFEVMSEPQAFSLYIGQSEYVDIDGDAKKDMSIKLLDIIYRKALVQVTSLAADGRSKIELLPPRPPRPRTTEVAEPVQEEAVEVQEAVEPTAPAPAPVEPESVPKPVEQAPPEPITKKVPIYWMYTTAVLVILVIILLFGFIRRGSTGISEPDEPDDVEQPPSGDALKHDPSSEKPASGLKYAPEEASHASTYASKKAPETKQGPGQGSAEVKGVPRKKT
ncbi:hypothetical protein ACFL3V_04355 [Nanoarchaeota archaeon]